MTSCERKLSMALARYRSRFCTAIHFSRPFHGLSDDYAFAIPAMNCWAISIRPLRGLVINSAQGLYNAHLNIK